MLHLIADKIISSAGDEYVFHPFGKYNEVFKEFNIAQSFIFLQHGVTKDDQTAWLNRYNMNFKGIVTAARREYESFLSLPYYYNPENIWLTGFPRFDRLYQDDQGKITIMPTWRKNLVSEMNFVSEMRGGKAGFKDTSYYRFYKNLLTDERLLEAAEKNNYQLCFLLHPAMRAYEDAFDGLKGVTIIKHAEYRRIYAESSLVVTDYSSAVFDFAYLRKPVVYCQFDKNSFYDNHLYRQGYFDYEKDGFGEVETTLEGIVNRIIEYINEDCKLKEKYLKRINSFFNVLDTNNCERVLKKILEI